MFSIDLYEFSIELPKNSTPHLRFICPMFSGEGITYGNFIHKPRGHRTVEGEGGHGQPNVSIHTYVNLFYLIILYIGAK